MFLVLHKLFQQSKDLILFLGHLSVLKAKKEIYTRRIRKSSDIGFWYNNTNFTFHTFFLAI